MPESNRERQAENRAIESNLLKSTSSRHKLFNMNRMIINATE